MSDSADSNIRNRTEKDVARETGQAEGTENRENVDPTHGPLVRDGAHGAMSSAFEEDDEED